MESGRGSSQDPPLTECELRRNENIAQIQAKLKSFNIPTLSDPIPPAKKRAKRTHKTNDGETHDHNLRPRPQTNPLVNVNEEIDEEDLDCELIDEDWECEPVGDFLGDNEDFYGSTQKRKGRSITVLKDLFERQPGMPKIKIPVNHLGQPIGDNYRRFVSAVGCHVRKKLSVAYPDWRKIDIKKKMAVWADIKQTYDIGDDAVPWFLGNAAKIWKGFKSYLKKQYFDGKLTEQQIRKIHGDRLNDDDWKTLKEYWASKESEARTIQAKASRANLIIHHTSGSMSFAQSAHKMGIELGRPPRRDEVYIKTHTRKNGVPLPPAEPIINKLKSIIEERPELTQKTIQEGDAFAAACGEKEPKGRVRVLGLGPTPQSVGTPGVKSYIPTRIQLEVMARRDAEVARRDVEAEQEALRQRIVELEQQLLEERLAHERSNMENNSQNGSNSRHHVSPRSVDDGVGTRLDAEFFEDDPYEEQSNECGYIIMRRPATTTPSQQPPQSTMRAAPAQQPPQSTMRAAPAQQPPQSTMRAAPSQQPPQSPMRAAPSQQPPQSTMRAAPSQQPPRSSHVHAQQPQPHLAINTRNNCDTNRFPYDKYIGREVILYPNMKSAQPVAKGIVIATNPSRVLAGQALGRQFCEVIVKLVMKRDAVLPRPYVGVENMADTKDLSIAWPYNWLKLCKTSKSSQCGEAAGLLQGGHGGPAGGVHAQGQPLENHLFRNEPCSGR